METINLAPIGYVRRGSANETPAQSSEAMGEKGHIEILPEFQEGLKDLDGFSHIIVIYYFHMSNGHKLSVKSFKTGEEHGVFATRSPLRPNALGFSILKVSKIKNNTIGVDYLDIFDNTPILDIKPYVAKFDSRENTSSGWLS